MSTTFSIKSAKAYANNAVAIIVWQPNGFIKDCAGFEITRIYADGTERTLASWVPFEGQDNKDWSPQDTSVWPVQKFWWRDLTARQRRDQASLRSTGDTVRYRIRALVLAKPGLAPVTSANKQSYTGNPVALSYLDAGVITNPVSITSEYGPYKAVFNNGILSTQWLSHAMSETMKLQPTRENVKKEIANINSQIRQYLAGDLPLLISEMFAKLDKGGKIYLALYELTDPFLLELILSRANRVHLILSNTGMDKDTKLWDEENAPVRQKLHQAQLAEIHDRMFNNSAHIGHNKFVVYVDASDVPRSVFSGSTNWTPNGLCAQSNNGFLLECDAVAGQYMTYWNDLKLDNDRFTIPEPITAASSNAQDKPLRELNAKPLDAILLENTWAMRLWRSPNTPQKSKPKNPPIPPDIQEIYYLMSQARKAIFFAVFLPGLKGATSIIDLALGLAEQNPELIVHGVISSAMAMPNYKTAKDKAEEGGTPSRQPALYEKGRVRLVLASALTKGDITGDFEAELLSAGNAIIHDKILVIDPVSDDSVVVTGSHNLGYKASYANDDNLIIIRRNEKLAQAYAVHILDLYDHYRYRAVMAERKGQGKTAWSGFLKPDDSWQNKYKSGPGELIDYFG